jgi:hypothetical protein
MAVQAVVAGQLAALLEREILQPQVHHKALMEGLVRVQMTQEVVVAQQHPEVARAEEMVLRQQFQVLQLLTPVVVEVGLIVGLVGQGVLVGEVLEDRQEEAVLQVRLIQVVVVVVETIVEPEQMVLLEDRV